MDYRHIAIEGNIGSGKTTLARLLAAHYGARLVLEEFDDNNFLPKFYQEPGRYAFPLELSFLADRYKQLKAVSNPELFQETIVSDFVFTKSKLFARVNLKDDEYELFSKLFAIVGHNAPLPDVMIYLHAPANKLMQHIQLRGRGFEQQITPEYLEQLQQVYTQYLRQNACRTIVIDTEHTDFNDPAQLAQLTGFLDKGYEFTQHYMAIEPAAEGGTQ